MFTGFLRTTVFTKPQFQVISGYQKGGVGYVLSDVNPCKGCICTSCAKSEKNGVLYLCGAKACDNCENSEYIVKRSYCDFYVPLDEYEADDLRL